MIGVNPQDFSKLDRGFLPLALRRVDDAEIVVCVGVVRIDLNGSFQQGLCLGELPAFAHFDPQLVECSEVVGINPQGLLKLFHGFRRLALLQQDSRQVEMGLRKTRIELDRLPELAFGFGTIEPFIGDPQIIARPGVLRVLVNRLFELLHRLVELARL